jgi:hypothetical protein
LHADRERSTVDPGVLFVILISLLLLLLSTLISCPVICFLFAQSIWRNAFAQPEQQAHCLMQQLLSAFDLFKRTLSFGHQDVQASGALQG